MLTEKELKVLRETEKRNQKRHYLKQLQKDYDKYVSDGKDKYAEVIMREILTLKKELKISP